MVRKRRLSEVVDDHGYTVTRLSDYIMFEIENGMSIEDAADKYNVDVDSVREYVVENKG